MIKRLFYFYIIFFVLGSCTSKGLNANETNKNDSVSKYIKLATNETLDTVVRNRYNDKAFSFLDLSKNDTLTRFYLSSISYNYMRTGSEKLIHKIGATFFEKSLESNDILNLARFYRYRAGYLKNKHIYDSSFYYYLKAEKYYKKINDEKGLAIVNNNKRQIQFSFDDYSGANISTQIAYKYFKKTDNFSEQYHTLIALGNIYTILREFDKAIEAFKLALTILEKDNSIDSRGTCLNNLGNVYREQGKFKKAIFYIKKGLREKTALKKDSCLHGFLLNNLSCCKLEMKDYSGLPNMIFKSIQLMKDREGIKESIMSYIYLSRYFSAINDTVKAQIYAEEGLKIAKTSGAPYYYLTALSNAGGLENKKASKYIREYHKISDSLFFVENKAKNRYYTIQLETEEIKQEKADVIKQKWIIAGVSGFTIVIFVLLLVITRQKAKEKELQLLQSQQKVNEEIYDLMLHQKTKEELARQDEKNRIALELHDGVMNRLASTRLNLDVLNYKNDPETIAKCLNYIDDIYKLEQEIRNISHNLNQEMLISNNSFTTMLRDFINNQNDTFSTNFQLELDNILDWNDISTEIRMNFFRIIQEACHNINKFSEAENAVISILCDNKNLCLSITDDGKGFDDKVDIKGIGLKNIRKRVETLCGKIVIRSIKDKGTSLNIAVPIA